MLAGLATNLSGSGLVCFKYPGAHALSDGEYQVVGHANSKEAIDLEIEDKTGKKVSSGPSKQPSAGRNKVLDAPSTPQKGPEEKAVDGLPPTSGPTLSQPPSYPSTPGRSASLNSRESSPSVANSGSGRAPFGNTIPKQPDVRMSTPASDKHLATPSSATSNSSVRSKLGRRFSSSASMILRGKGDKRTVNSQA